ncbi:MAG: sigma-70 family RNA polymerase sigma factor [Calditrichaeota bacterium]|nr:MAG: sigma-70 family RNA polymerase sigma factor [Calditrichota bacterium]
MIAPDENEISLIVRAQRGDEKAFEELVKKHDHSVLTFALYMTGNRLDAEDVYQESFLRAFKRLTGFRFESSFKTWLLSIVVRQSINMRKKRRLRQVLSLNRQEEWENEASLLCSDQDEAEQTVKTKEMMQLLGKSLNRLTDRERAIFCLKNRENLKIREIAELLDCAEGTVKNLLFRACRKLRQEMEPYFRD